MRKTMTFALLMLSPFASAGDCPWLEDSRIDSAFPDRAPWSVMSGGQGRCKWVSDSSKPASTISLTQMIQESDAEAADYAKTVGGGMAKSYAVSALPGIGKAGVAVREQAADGRMLTLIGHQKKIVVMTQLSFHGGVSAEQQATAEKLTQETFVADTGGGLVMPKKK